VVLEKSPKKSGMSSKIFDGLHRTRAVEATRSKKPKNSKKKGSNKLSKQSKKEKRKGGGSSSSDSDALPDAPTAAPTCLECDDLRSVENAFARGGNLSSRSDSVRRVVFVGSFFVLLVFCWILLLLHRSSRQRRQQQLQKSVEYLGDKPDDATYVEDDWIVVID
jgi:hypothetical protein